MQPPSNKPVHLKGISWNHTRGFVPVVATAQRFEELYPDIRITWEKRSLQAFADASLEELAAAYDIIVMDHPHTAVAARQRILLPLDEHLPAEFLADQSAGSVGRSHASYHFDGHQWTLATDAACPVATWRPDLMRRHALEPPGTWEEVLYLAEQGAVTVSLYPLDALMHLYMFCDALGSPAFQSPQELAPVGTMTTALDQLRQLASRCAPECLRRNPIRTAEYMSSTEDKAAAYCPFAYGYSNYSRPGFSRFPLKAGGLVAFNGRRLRPVLGGAGLAVSARTQHLEEAVRYAAFTASPAIQKGIYFAAGGQPGHRSAWEDAQVNAACMDFFKDTLPTLDGAIVRPAYPGYMRFQDAATPVMGRFLAGDQTLAAAIAELNALFRQSLSSPYGS